jgi:uncharacterized membrane protein YeaQ/YmgE (transglycosylase-associated protein family)
MENAGTADEMGYVLLLGISILCAELFSSLPGRGLGLFGDIFVAFVGAYFGATVAAQIGDQGSDLWTLVACSIAGSLAVLLVVRRIRRVKA